MNSRLNAQNAVLEPRRDLVRVDIMPEGYISTLWDIVPCRASRALRHRFASQDKLRERASLTSGIPSYG